MKGVGGGIAAVFEQKKSFVFLGDNTTLAGNVAQMLGGGVYMYSKSDGCKTDTSDGWDPAELFQLPQGAVKQCGVSFSGTRGLKDGNDAFLGGKVLAWTGQAAFQVCCGSENGTDIVCSKGSQPEPICPVTGQGDKPSDLYATLPAQLLAYNKSCLCEVYARGNGSHPPTPAAAECGLGDFLFEAGKPVRDSFDKCLLGASSAPERGEFKNKSSVDSQAVRLYSGAQVNITAVVVDGYHSVMDLTTPAKDELVMLINHDLPGPTGSQLNQTAAAEGYSQAAAAWAVNDKILQPAMVQLQQKDSRLFVIGNLTVPLGVTAAFTDLALQPVIAPRANMNYSFNLTAGEKSNILRQVGRDVPPRCPL